jgi:hypothetical protein
LNELCPFWQQVHRAETPPVLRRVQALFVAKVALKSDMGTIVSAASEAGDFFAVGPVDGQQVKTFLWLEQQFAPARWVFLARLRKLLLGLKRRWQRRWWQLDLHDMRGV